MRLFVILMMIFFAATTASLAQSDCIQKVNELEQEPIRTDTLVEINPKTYKETTFYVDVYIDIDADDALDIDKKTEKDDRIIYYIRKDDCFMIQRIEVPAKKR